MRDAVRENSEETVGVLGGMGPDATVQFIQELLSATPAERDEDHLTMIVYNDPKIPDRNQAILENKQSPVPRLKHNARKLESSGVDFIAIPCNTAHYYYDAIDKSVDIEVLHMIKLVRNELERRDLSEAGLLATSTVVETDLYKQVFHNSDIQIRHPENTDLLMDAIYATKKGNKSTANELVDMTIERFVEDGVSTFLIGCTDLSTLPFSKDHNVIDTTTLLAEQCVNRVKSNKN